MWKWLPPVRGAGSMRCIAVRGSGWTRWTKIRLTLGACILLLGATMYLTRQHWGLRRDEARGNPALAVAHRGRSAYSTPEGQPGGSQDTSPLTPSADYAVFVDGIPRFVYIATVAGVSNYTNSSFIYVDLEPGVQRDVVVQVLGGNLSRAVLRPRGSPLIKRTGPATLGFQILEPGNFVLEVDGEYDFQSFVHGLMIFADFRDPNPPSPEDPSTIYFGPGLHRLPMCDIGTGLGKSRWRNCLSLRSDTTLYLAGGAVVMGLIRAEGIRNVTVRGHGILVGSHYPGDAVPPDMADCCCCTCYGDTAIQIANGSGVLVEGITVLHSTGWNLRLKSLMDVSVRRIKVIGWQCMNDGIDIDSSQDVLVEGCFIRSDDDSIAVKGMDATMDSRAIMVRDSFLWMQSYGNCMEIGYELWNSAISNVTFQRITCIHQAGSIMSIHNAGRAVVQDVLYEDVVAEGLWAFEDERPDQGLKVFDFIVTYGQYADPKARSARGSIQRVRLQNVQYHPHKQRWRFARVLGNSSTHEVNSVAFRNFCIDGEALTSLEDVHAATNSFIHNIDFGPQTFSPASS